MTITSKITAMTAFALAVAASTAMPAAVAAPAQQGAGTQTREVCAGSTYVTKRPAAIPLDTVHRGEDVKVGRRSKSGKWVYTVVERPNHTTRGWVKVADLCAKGRSPEFMKTSRYSVRIVNSLAGGDPGFFYVGGPANVTVRDTQRAGQPVRVCVTPAPVERSSCRTGRTGQTIDTIAWSAAGPTEVRISIEGGPVLVDTIYPYDIQPAGARR